MYNLKTININPVGDGCSYLFVDGKYVTGGDDYHDKIDEQIEGIKTFLDKMEFEYSYESIKIESEHWVVNAELMNESPDGKDFQEFFDHLHTKLEEYDAIYVRDDSLNALYEHDSEDVETVDKVVDIPRECDDDGDDEEGIDDYIPSNY